MLMTSTFESLAQGLLNEYPDRVHQDADRDSNIQPEQTQLELQQLQLELNAHFARTIQLSEERREPRVHSAVHVLCQSDQAACSQSTFSGRVFPDSKAVKEAMDKFEHSTQTCSHVTQHGQTGGKIRYKCQRVCSKGQLCKLNPGACEFSTCKKVGPANGKCGLLDRCPFKVIFSTERKKGGEQSDSDQFSVSKGCSISDHSLTCGALGASSQQLTKSMLHNT